MESREFYVQSIDYYWVPINEKARIDLARQAREVFIEGEPLERWDSLQAAVANFAPNMDSALQQAQETRQNAPGGAA